MSVPVVNLGGQYNHLICRILTELGVESELLSPDLTLQDLRKKGAMGLVLGGSPRSMPEDLKSLGNLPTIIYDIKIPVLGICLGHQFLGVSFGGVVQRALRPEFGPARIYVDAEDDILEGMGRSFVAWLSHNDELVRLPDELEALAHSRNCRIQAVKHRARPIYGVQFHPEVVHTRGGDQVFRNFLKVCRGRRPRFGSLPYS